MGKALFWVPRILSSVYPVVLVVVAIVDSFRYGFNFGGFAIMFALFLIMTALVAAGWKWPKAGGIIFILMSGLVTLSMLTSEVGFEWPPFLTGALPFTVIGVTYLLSGIIRD